MVLLAFLPVFVIGALWAAGRADTRLDDLAVVEGPLLAPGDYSLQSGSFTLELRFAHATLRLGRGPLSATRAAQIAEASHQGSTLRVWVSQADRDVRLITDVYQLDLDGQRYVTLDDALANYRRIRWICLACSVLFGFTGAYLLLRARAGAN